MSGIPLSSSSVCQKLRQQGVQKLFINKGVVEKMSCPQSSPQLPCKFWTCYAEIRSSERTMWNYCPTRTKIVPRVIKHGVLSFNMSVKLDVLQVLVSGGARGTFNLIQPHSEHRPVVKDVKTKNLTFTNTWPRRARHQCSDLIRVKFTHLIWWIGVDCDCTRLHHWKIGNRV